MYSCLVCFSLCKFVCPIFNIFLLCVSVFYFPFVRLAMKNSQTDWTSNKVFKWKSMQSYMVGRQKNLSLIPFPIKCLGVIKPPLLSAHRKKHLQTMYLNNHSANTNRKQKTFFRRYLLRMTKTQNNIYLRISNVIIKMYNNND